MLTSEWKKSNKKKGFTTTCTFAVPWSQNTVRFSEELQIVDLGDCFAVVYTTSPASASVAMHKYFTADRESTFNTIDAPTDVFYTAKWEGTHQGRTCVKVYLAMKFFRTVLNHMQNAEKLAQILDKERLTVVGAMEDFNARGEVIIEDKTKTMLAIAKSTVTREEALSQANTALVLSGYNTKIIAEKTEDDLRINRAQNAMKAENIKTAELWNISNLKVEHERAVLDAKRECEKEGNEYDKLAKKFRVAEENGLECAKILKQKLESVLTDGL
jgi:hypothetical protein